jgi:fatty-acyl-CoA synthase
VTGREGVAVSTETTGDRAAGARTYIEILMRRLADGGAAPVLRYRGQDTTAAGLATSIFRYARALAGLGIGPGRLVALFATTSPDALAVRYAANLLGAGSAYLRAPPDPRRRAELVAGIDAQLLVVFPETAGLLPSGLAVPVGAVGGEVTPRRRWRRSSPSASPTCSSSNRSCSI